MNLDVLEFALLVHPLVGMTRVPMLKAISIRESAVSKEHYHLVDSLGILAQKIPEHIFILQVRLRIAFLGVDKVRELDWIAYKEDRGVVEDPVPVSFLGADLDCETMRITRSVRRASLAADSGETHGNGGAVADLVEDSSTADVGDIVGDLEVTVCTGTLCMDDTLGNTLAVKMREEVDVVEVYNQTQ